MIPPSTDKTFEVGSSQSQPVVLAGPSSPPDVQAQEPSGAFSLDTSGEVQNVPSGIDGICGDYRWPDLTPFQQGYVEALFAGLSAASDFAADRGLRFSDLSPEALALILRDCDAAQDHFPRTPFGGAAFWRIRQGGHIGPPTTFLSVQRRFPPLRVFLSDEGKVCLGEAEPAAHASQGNGPNT